MEISLAVTTKAGVPVVPQLTDVEVKAIKWVLNEPVSWSFRMARNHPQAALVPKSPVDANEVQLWIDGVLKAWGPVVRRDRHTVQCQDVRWYMAHRFLGPVFEFTLAFDGSFELTAPGAGNLPSGWTQSGLAGDYGIVDNFGNHGNHALYLGPVPMPTDGFISVVFGPVTATEPSEVEFSAWYQSDDYAFADRQTFEERGLYVLRWDSPPAGLREVANGAIDITDKQPLNQWRRTVAKMTQPVGSSIFEIRFYAASLPGGKRLYWDTFDFRFDQRTFSTEAEDASALIQRLVDYATGAGHGGGPPPGYTGDPVLKSDLLLPWDPANSSSIGRIGARSYDHSSADSFEACLSEFPRRGLCDMEVTYTTAPGALSSRKWTIFAPSKGTDRTTWSFTYDGDTGMGNIADYDPLWDGMQSASQSRVPGPGRAGVESGLATGTGTLVEMILPAIDGSDLNAVQEIAEADQVRRQQAQIPWILVPDATSWLAKGMTTGDTIHPAINDGWIHISGAYRIMAIELDPAADTLKLTLNAA